MKYEKLYGLSSPQLAEKFGVSRQAIYRLHLEGRLAECIEKGGDLPQHIRKVYNCKLRRKYGYSGKELAKMTGVRLSAISGLEQAGKLEELLKKCEKFRDRT